MTNNLQKSRQFTCFQATLRRKSASELCKTLCVTLILLTIHYYCSGTFSASRVFYAEDNCMGDIIDL